MSPTVRLRLSLAIIVFSAMYALLVVHDPTIAAAVSAGYVAVLLTVVTALNVWKKP